MTKQATEQPAPQKPNVASRLQSAFDKRKEEREFIEVMPWDKPEFQKAYENMNLQMPGLGKAFRLPGHMRAQLSAPLPADAIKASFEGSKGLSTVKSAYQKERMNEVFGIGGWTYEDVLVSIVPSPVYKWKAQKKERVGEIDYFTNYVLVRTRVYIREFDLYSPWYWGGWVMDDYHQDIGDAMKSAVTSSLSKCLGEYFEVGIQVYKGDPTSQVANIGRVMTADERDRLEREYIEGATGLQSNEQPAAEAPAEQPAAEAQTAPFALADLKKLKETEEAVKLFDDSGIEWQPTYKERSGNTKVTKAGLVRWYEKTYGKNPNIDPNVHKTAESNPEDSTANDAGGSAESKENAPSADAGGAAEAPEESGQQVAPEETAPATDNVSDTAPAVDTTSDAGSEQPEGPAVEEPAADAPSAEAPIPTEEVTTSDVLDSFKAEVDGFLTMEEFNHSEEGYKELWVRANQSFEHKMLTRDDLVELQGHIEAHAAKLQSPA